MKNLHAITWLFGVALNSTYYNLLSIESQSSKEVPCLSTVKDEPIWPFIILTNILNIDNPFHHFNNRNITDWFRHQGYKSIVYLILDIIRRLNWIIKFETAE